MTASLWVNQSVRQAPADSEERFQRRLVSTKKQEHLIERLLGLTRLTRIDLLCQLSKRLLSCFLVQRLILCM